MDNKVFNRKLNAFGKGINSKFDNLQELIQAGFEQVEASGNTVYLSRTLQVCVGAKGLPTNAIKDYIKAHCTPLVWSKNKDGNFVFKKDGKDAVLEVTMPTKAWYEWESVKKTQASEDMDIDKMAKLFIGRLNKGLKEGKVKDQRKAIAMIAALTSPESTPAQPQSFDEVDS